jgi:hypothetical protein
MTFTFDRYFDRCRWLLPGVWVALWVFIQQTVLMLRRSYIYSAGCSAHKYRVASDSYKKTALHHLADQSVMSFPLVNKS